MQFSAVDPRISKLMKKALKEQGRGERKEAASLYRKILDLDRDHLDAHYLLGTLYAEAGNYLLAEKHLKTAHGIKRDSPMVLNNLAGVYRLSGQPEAAIGLYEQALALDPNLVEAHRNLGFLYKKVGQYEAATGHYLRAALFLPDSHEVLLGLATCYLESGDPENAADYFRRVLALKPDHAVARHLLAACSGETPEQPPREYVSSLFDEYADRFDQQLVNTLGYCVPELLRKAITGVRGQERRYARAVDLGCGTGLVGEQMRGLVDALVGVDLSPRMIERARERGVYDELHREDGVEFLEGDARFDLFLAADVLIYLGDLDPLFAAVRKAALPGALFAVSCERHDGEGYVLRPSGRYAQSPAYIQALADRHGFRVEALEHHDLRKQHGAWVPGFICCLGVPA